MVPSKLPIFNDASQSDILVGRTKPNKSRDMKTRSETISESSRDKTRRALKALRIIREKLSHTGPKISRLEIKKWQNEGRR